MEAEIELHFPATASNDEHRVITQVTVSCPTELANIAYGMQQRAGYRTRTILKPNGAKKTVVVGLAAEFVSFGPVIARDEQGLPAYESKKKKA